MEENKKIVENKIGIDKLYLYQLSGLGNIDFNKFDKKILNKSEKMIKIIDNNKIEDISFKFTENDKGIFIKSAYIKLDVSKVNGNNIVPLNYDDYDAYIRECIDYIENKYDFTFDYEQIRVGYIELNVNYIRYYKCEPLLHKTLA